jgi:hypothetical protein
MASPGLKSPSLEPQTSLENTAARESRPGLWLEEKKKIRADWAS